MKICLYGIHGVYNYGCEAMVRAISARFMEMDPNNRVLYKTWDVENDSRILKDCKTVEVSPLVPKYFGVNKVKKFIRRSFSFIRKRIRMPQVKDIFPFQLDWVEDCDVLVVIGGDVFDIVPSRKKKKYFNERIILSELVR